MYRCWICDARFEQPAIERYREDMNGEGATQLYTVPHCPVCGSEWFEVDDETD